MGEIGQAVRRPEIPAEGDGCGTGIHGQPVGVLGTGVDLARKTDGIVQGRETARAGDFDRPCVALCPGGGDTVIDRDRAGAALRQKGQSRAGPDGDTPRGTQHDRVPARRKGQSARTVQGRVKGDSAAGNTQHGVAEKDGIRVALRAVRLDRPAQGCVVDRQAGERVRPACATGQGDRAAANRRGQALNTSGGGIDGAGKNDMSVVGGQDGIRVQRHASIETLGSNRPDRAGKGRVAQCQVGERCAAADAAQQTDRPGCRKGKRPVQRAVQHGGTGCGQRGGVGQGDAAVTQIEASRRLRALYSKVGCIDGNRPGTDGERPGRAEGHLGCRADPVEIADGDAAIVGGDTAVDEGPIGVDGERDAGIGERYRVDEGDGPLRGQGDVGRCRIQGGRVDGHIAGRVARVGD